jgi:multidrug efflux system outer membrane protein
MKKEVNHVSSRSPFRLLAMALALALAGCATAPRDTIVQPSPDFARAQHAATIKLARDGWPEARWWTRYDDAQLNALVERALKDSPTMAVAATRIGYAQAALSSTRSVGGGSLGLELGLNRQRYSGNGFFPAPIGGSFYTDAAVQVKASYDFDWWGKQRAPARPAPRRPGAGGAGAGCERGAKLFAPADAVGAARQHAGHGAATG